MGNNMLYIIVGLVVVLLVVVLVLRKNKAQKQPTRPITQVDKGVGANTSVPKVGRANANQSATKFDHLTVAQRFMDQQRYDKAIESVERGLVEKPNDSPLLLKLLNIYAITNQYSEFSKTYKAIRAHGDTSTIDEAEQLKALVDQEQSPTDVAAFEPIGQSSFGGLDFDLPTDQKISTEVQADELETKNDFGMSEPNDSVSDFGTDDNFALTLDDLETSHSEVDVIEPTNTIESTSAIETADSSDIDDAFGLNKDSLLSDDLIAEPTVNDSFNNAQNIDNDFSLSFDTPADVESESTTDAFNDNSLNELNLSDDDFVLDFDDLTTNTSDIDNVLSTEQQPTDQENFDDFTLAFNDEDSATTNTANAPTSDNVSENVLGANVEDTLSQLDNLSFDDMSFDDDTTSVLDNETNSTEAPVSTANNELPDSQTFDDNTPIDDDFDFDNFVDEPTATTPVVEENDNLDFQNTEIAPTTDFAAQFAADFDFVKTLDSNQVTLDLAAQYLQLGEYDSAKRLLNEVIIQGDSEQKNQAQSLLARTA